MKIRGVADPFTARALKLMGVETAAVTTREDALKALDEAARPETVVLVSEATARLAREKVDALKVARQNFIVIEIPSGEGVPRQAEETAKLVSQAIGVKI